MLSTGSNIASCESSVVSSIPTLHLTETSSILERIFKYIYPTIIDTVNDEQWNEDWLELGLYRQDIKEEITAIDKYKVSTVTMIFEIWSSESTSVLNRLLEELRIFTVSISYVLNICTMNLQDQ